jgi:hypothetical protein
MHVDVQIVLGESVKQRKSKKSIARRDNFYFVSFVGRERERGGERERERERDYLRHSYACFLRKILIGSDVFLSHKSHLFHLMLLSEWRSHQTRILL